jgi:hypothetical protein
MPELLRTSLEVIVLSLVVSTTSVTVTKARVFREVRHIAARHGSWLGDLMRCPYCISHWISLLLVTIYRPCIVRSGVALADCLVSVFVIVAIATVWSQFVCFSLHAMDSLKDGSDRDL